jgi:hypothetical protein
MTKSTRIILSAASLGLACSSMTHAQFSQWEDHPVGTSFLAGDTTMSDDVQVAFSPVQYPDGHTHSHHAEVLGEDAPCNAFNRIELVVMTAKFDFGATIGIQNNPRFTSRHNGGMINLSINGSAPAFALDWMAYDGTTIGGVVVRVLSGGFSGDCTEILLEGGVKDCSIALEEGWVDAPAPCDVPTYDDIPLGAAFGTGDTFVTDGIPSKIKPFLLPDGSYFSGSAQIGLADRSCGIDFELETSTCVVSHDFSGFGGATDVSFRVGEQGGEVNLFINGAGLCASDWIDYDGLSLGGVLVAITRGGLENQCTEVELTGLVSTLGIGGQEHSVDCLEWLENDDDGSNGNDECASYDHMAPGPDVMHHAYDTFSTDGILCTVRTQKFPDGSEFTAGSAFSQPSTYACGSGQELATYACAVDHRFADSIGPLDEVSLTVADHGGQINFEINGDFRMPAQYIDLDGLMVGGVTITVLSGGRLNECTELLLEGRLENLLVGGGQHFVDCLTGTPAEPDQPGDANGDGVIDGLDLAKVLGGWGQAEGDVNGDGITDGSDLSMVLGNWSGN